MKKVDVKISTYQLTKNFYVEVADNNKTLDFFIYHISYGIKSFMFGISKGSIHTEKEIESLIENNYERYMVSYYQDYILSEEA